MTGQTFFCIPGSFSGLQGITNHYLLPSSPCEQGPLKLSRQKFSLAEPTQDPKGNSQASLGEYLGHLKSSRFATMLTDFWVLGLAPGAA